MWLKCSLCSKNFFTLLLAIFFELPVLKLPITRTFFWFPLKVWVIGSWLYIMMTTVPILYRSFWSHWTFFFSLVNFADEPPTWGHPPDPKVQSKSFKRLQRHLQEHEDDGMYIVCHYHLTDNKLCDSSVIVFCYSVYLWATSQISRLSTVNVIETGLRTSNSFKTCLFTFRIVLLLLLSL